MKIFLGTYHLLKLNQDQTISLSRLITPHVIKDVDLGEHLSIACGSANFYSHYGHQCGGSSGRWELIYPQDPAVSFLSIYSKNDPPYHSDTDSAMFIAALFMVSRNWKQP